MSALSNMLENQIRSCEITNETVLETITHIPRAGFVPPEFKSVAYSESFIPLNHHEVMLTPFIEAAILNALQVKENETALVVGTGSGYLTALIAAQAQHVLSLDIHDDLLSATAEKLKLFQIYNVTLENRNGCLGHDKHAPYPIIVLAGGILSCPDVVKKQLAVGGRLFSFIGPDPLNLAATLITRPQTHLFEKKILFETSLPLLHHQPSQSFKF